MKSRYDPGMLHDARNRDTGGQIHVKHAAEEVAAVWMGEFWRKIQILKLPVEALGGSWKFPLMMSPTLSKGKTPVIIEYSTTPIDYQCQFDTY